MEENFSPQQSLQLIQSMIDKTKANISQNRIYFLLWGWLTFAGFIGQFLLKRVFGYQHHYLVWLITFVGLFFTIRYNRRDRRQGPRTYIGDAMGYLWSGMAASFFVLCVIITFLKVPTTGWLYCYPFFILMYGLGTFVSGKILQFNPLVTGGVLNWVLACAAVFVPYDYQMLLAAAAILTSYIIPGHLLQTQKSPAA